MMHYSLVPSDFGWAAVGWSEEGIAVLRLPAPSQDKAREAIGRQLPHADARTPPPMVTDVIARVQAYFTGARVDFDDVPLALARLHPLHGQILSAVRLIGWGETTTYGAVARTLGTAPELPRVVGQVMARNPVPLIVPCHRVLAAGGRSGGFSAPGGADAKRRMLALEGVRLDPDDMLEQAQTAFVF